LWLTWSVNAGAISLGSPAVLSKPGDPLRVEIPIRLGPEEQEILNSIEVTIPSKDNFDRLGISSNILDFNIQSMIYRNKQEKLMILVETVSPIPLSEDPFIDLLVNVKWSSGNVTKAFSLLLGDPQKILVKPGQTLSEIALQMAPRLDGANVDQTMMALFKANPDAFASGSINRLLAGSELSRPSSALLRSISPAEANQFVAQARDQWQADQESKRLEGSNGKTTASDLDATSGNRLRIGSSLDGNEDEKRYIEELVTQEKLLEQTKLRVAELEKNIADLQNLLDKSKSRVVDKAKEQDQFFIKFAPGLVVIVLVALTGVLLWFLARNARRSEMTPFAEPGAHSESTTTHTLSSNAISEKTKALLAGLDLELTPHHADLAPSQPIVEKPDLLTDNLRVKLNLARAYIAIEDFAAAKKSLEEILKQSSPADSTIVVDAQALLSELSHGSH
jgi:pilus assembly protein FimV